MSRRHAWTSWYWDEWDTDTATLSDSEYAIYHRLLKHYYKSQKPLEANASSLPRLCLAFDRAQKVAMNTVLEKFFTLGSDGCYHNKRADIELEKMLSISKERVEAGRRGGLSKAKKVANATPLPQQTEQQNPTQSQPQSQPQESKPRAEVSEQSFTLDAAVSYVLIETGLAGKNIRDVIHQIIARDIKKLSVEPKQAADAMIAAWQKYDCMELPYKFGAEKFFGGGTWRKPEKEWGGDKTGPQNVASDYVPLSEQRRKEQAERKAAGL